MNKKFGKIISLPLLSLFILIGSMSILIGFKGTASAQNELLFGQNHYYTVIFRGNGEAIIYAKMVITNPDEKPLKEFSFEMPKVTSSEMAIYQMKLPQECAKYDYDDRSKKCLQYRDPDYSRSYGGNNLIGYGGNGEIEYQKVQYIKSKSLYRFTFPTEIEPYKSTAIIIAYAAKGYVNETAGLYKFQFESLKISSRIQEIRVAVDIDTDLVMKGKRSSVNYNTETLSMIAQEDVASSISSRSLNNVVGKIGSYGPLVKTAKNLSPNESFIVKGEYAKNWLRLNVSSILLFILIIVAIVTAVYFLVKFLKRRSEQNVKNVSATDQQIIGQNPKNPIRLVTIANISVSFLSVAIIIGLTYLLEFLESSDFIQGFNGSDVFEIIAFITIVLLYILLIFGPAIIIALKRGWKSFIAILIAEFLWCLVFIVIYFIFFQMGLISGSYSRY
ncbi:hypothetical protein HYV57_02375 [Candidatus Peregrinibacteria bacterium]|nr:hypothetical protein [Candidatus Peregrinibacteria bacterium]